MSTCVHSCVEAIMTLLGVIIFARQFYGAASYPPFGWSFALTILAAIMFFINGILLILITVLVHLYTNRMRHQAAGRAPSAGFFGCFRDCFQWPWNDTLSALGNVYRCRPWIYQTHRRLMLLGGRCRISGIQLRHKLWHLGIPRARL